MRVVHVPPRRPGPEAPLHRHRRRARAASSDSTSAQAGRWTLDIATIAAELRERVARFEAWRAALVTRADILGGEPVFPGSRLAVRHVGEMLLRGADVAGINEDYPYLSEHDLEFALLYATAYPRIGRPRGQATAG